MIYRNAICHTESCQLNGLIMRGYVLVNSTHACGPCGSVVEDVTVALDQETKEGCVDFCPEPEKHIGPLDCNAAFIERNK